MNNHFTKNRILHQSLYVVKGQFFFHFIHFRFIPIYSHNNSKQRTVLIQLQSKFESPSCQSFDNAKRQMAMDAILHPPCRLLYYCMLYSKYYLDSKQQDLPYSVEFCVRIGSSQLCKRTLSRCRCRSFTLLTP